MTAIETKIKELVEPLSILLGLALILMTLFMKKKAKTTI